MEDKDFSSQEQDIERKTVRDIGKYVITAVIFVLIIVIVFHFKPSGDLADREIAEETSVEEQKNTRIAAYAGVYYPNREKDLRELIEIFFNESEKKDIDNIKAIVVPHAGYRFSGKIAATGFKQIEDNYDNVIIISSNHNKGIEFDGASIPDYDSYQSVLGEVELSDVSKELLKEEVFLTVKEAHSTHIIEVEIPFLQTVISNFEMIPIITGEMSDEQIEKAASSIAKFVDDKTLIVVSADLSHYYTYDEAVELDKECIDGIKDLDVDKCETCSLNALKILSLIAKERNWEPTFIEYANSGDTGKNKERVVGYVSVVFSE